MDLPGYGYAKVSKQERARWGKLIEQWFADTSLMTLGVLIVDLRHKPTADDCVMAQWFKNAGCPFVVVANKHDKIKKSEWAPNLARIRETLELDEDTPVISFSAEKGLGKEELLQVIFDHVTGGEAEAIKNKNDRKTRLCRREEQANETYLGSLPLRRLSRVFPSASAAQSSCG